MKIKSFQIYEGKVIGKESKNWDSRGEMFYAYSHAEAIHIAYKSGLLKGRQSMPLNPKPEFFIPQPPAPAPKLSLWARVKSLFATYADEMGKANG